MQRTELEKMQKISPTALLHAARQDNHRDRERTSHTAYRSATFPPQNINREVGEEEAKTHQSIVHAREARSRYQREEESSSDGRKHRRYAHTANLLKT
jgi:hypothetical protein